jgi:pilus assembly protein CpaE
MTAFIVTDHEPTGSRIRDVLTFGGVDCPSSHIVTVDAAALRLGRETQVDLIVAALPPDRERAIGMLPWLSRAAAGRLLAVGPSNDAKLVLHALRAGASDYVDVGELEAELEVALKRLAAAAAAPTEPGRLIALLSPNGGSGSSTLAANLAVVLAKAHGHVGLLDLKLETGDLASLLDVRPTFTLADLCQNASRLDRVMFERSLVKHESGVHVLAPPQKLADVASIRADGVGLAVSLARASFPYVVADLDHSFREEQLLLLRQSDVMLMVLRLDFTSLRNVRRALEHMDGLGLGREKVRLVVNRYGQPQEVPWAKAEEALGMKIGTFIPEDAKAVNRANNQGMPVVLSAPTAKVSRSIIQLARDVEGPTRKA